MKRARSKYQGKKSQELKQLALDYVENKIFGSWDIPKTEKSNIIGMVFLPIMFIEKKDIPKGLCHVYAYLKDAGPRSINGYPIFWSCSFLNKKEFQEFIQHVNKILEYRKKFLDYEKS